MTTYYVTTSGSDSNDGLTEGTAFATPGYAASQATTAGDKVWVKSGTYTITSTTANVSGGALSITDKVDFEGYETTIGDRAAKPLLDGNSLSGSTIVLLPNTARYGTTTQSFENFIVDGTSTWTYGVDGGGYIAIKKDLDVRNCVTGIRSAHLINCKTSNCTSSGMLNTNIVYNCFSDGDRIGIYSPSRSAMGCVVKDATYIGYRLGGYEAINCVAYNCVTGFTSASNQDIFCYKNLVAVNNTNLGFSNYYAPIVQCATYNNGADYSNSTDGRFYDCVSLTADPFNDPANNDFSLNSDAGGGELLKSRGFPHSLGVTTYWDVNAIQREVTAGGGGGGGTVSAIHPLRGTQ